MQGIAPCLWFDNQAEEAAQFYAAIFKDSKIGEITRYGDEGFEIHKMPAGTVLTVDFQIAGQDFVALNGGPVFKFNEAVSFQVLCDTQDEIDYYWNRLGEGGDEDAQQCGWLKDKFGLSWQIVPLLLPKLLRDKDPVKSGRVMAALLKMKKIQIAVLADAYEGKIEEE